MRDSRPLKRFRLGVVVLGIIFLVAVCGYRLFGMSLLDSVYLTIVTLSSVGFGEVSQISPPKQIFTILVIVFGVSTGFYIVGGFVQMVIEGEFDRALGQRRVARDVGKLTGHVIICGFGRAGEILASQLTRQKQKFVVIDHDPERIVEATSLGCLAITDDATEESAMVAAGVHRAKSVVAVLPTDAENVFLTLTARNLNSDLQIIARGQSHTAEKTLLQAGASRVVLPVRTGAMRMAAMITRPSAVELIELAAGRHVAEVEIEQLEIPEGSPLAGQTVRQSDVRAKHGLLVVAIRHSEENLEFNPGADALFEAGKAVIVMGRLKDIEKFQKEYGL